MTDAIRTTDVDVCDIRSQLDHMPMHYRPAQTHEYRGLVSWYNDLRENLAKLRERLWGLRESYEIKRS